MRTRTPWLLALTLWALPGLARAQGVLCFEPGRAPVVYELASARRAGFTPIDLSRRYVPPVFTDEPALGALGQLPYADSFRALADEQASPDDRYLELYGIFPSLRVLSGWLGDGARHTCHGLVDNAALASYAKRLGAAPPGAAPQAASARAREAAIAALQEHLRCDGLLPARAQKGVFDPATQEAVATFQRRNMIVARGVVDDETRAALLRSSLERDYLALLRALRERVVAATGLVEDGSAAARRGSVLGRTLDGAELVAVDALGPLPDGAEDRISPATEAAASALGWTSPEAARDALRAYAPSAFETLTVGVKLPALPRYHAPHMELRVEIDRGDVWYDNPYRSDGTRRPQPTPHRPTLVLFARTDRGEVPLLRWSTTIGGFQPELTECGALVLRYKESDVGACVWREVVAAPTWLPPDSTPDAELVTKIGPGRYALKHALFGPGFASAYGLVMMPHERVVPAQDGGAPRFVDRGIRTHGSVNYKSILRGSSHGCHRLFNHLALRLASFLVEHRSHVHHGSEAVRYRRRVHSHNVHTSVSIATRGYVYELTPPLPVTVLRGTLRGRRKTPITGALPLPPGLAR